MEEDSASPPSSEDDHDLHEMKAEELEKLDRMLIESPASRSFITMSERLALVTNNNSTEPWFYSAPSSPEKLESTQAPEESVSKSEQKRNSKSPEPPYITAPSSPEKSELTHTPEEPAKASKESITKSAAKSRKKRNSKSPKPCYVTAPSLPTMVKSKVS